MKKAGKDVEESSEISMEDPDEANDQYSIAQMENSGTSIGVGLVPNKTTKAPTNKQDSKSDEDFSDDDFEQDDEEQKKNPPAKVMINRDEEPKA